MDGLLISVEPPRRLGTAFTVHQQQNGVITFTHPSIRGTAKSCPYLLSRHSRVGDRHHLQPSFLVAFSLYTKEGLKSWNYFVGLP
jgi:hypothetical protein